MNIRLRPPPAARPARGDDHAPCSLDGLSRAELVLDYLRDLRVRHLVLAPVRDTDGCLPQQRLVRLGQGRMDHLRDLPPGDRNPHLPDRPWPLDARALSSASPPAG